MEWFSRQLSKDRARETAPFGPQALLQVLAKRVPRYLDDVDQGKLIYPACKRAPGDVDGNLGSIWDHTRLEAMRYVMVVPRREFQLLAEPSRQPEMVEAYLRQRPHEDTVIEFTGSTMGDLAIAVIAGFNWLNRCATLVEVNRERFSGTLNNFRKIAVLAQQWWAMDGAAARCGQMLLAQFEAIDTDHDGSIDAAELKAGQSKLQMFGGERRKRSAAEEFNGPGEGPAPQAKPAASGASPTAGR